MRVCLWRLGTLVLGNTHWWREECWNIVNLKHNYQQRFNFMMIIKCFNVMSKKIPNNLNFVVFDISEYMDYLCMYFHIIVQLIFRIFTKHMLSSFWTNSSLSNPFPILLLGTIFILGSYGNLTIQDLFGRLGLHLVMRRHYFWLCT